MPVALVLLVFCLIYAFIRLFVPAIKDCRVRQLPLRSLLAIGTLAGRCGWLDKMSNSTGLTSLALGVLLAIGNYVRSDGTWSAFVWHWFGIYESLMCIFIPFGLIWLFREYANFTGKFLFICPRPVWSAISLIIRRPVTSFFSTIL